MVYRYLLFFFGKQSFRKRCRITSSELIRFITFVNCFSDHILISESVNYSIWKFQFTFNNNELDMKHEISDFLFKRKWLIGPKVPSGLLHSTFTFKQIIFPSARPPTCHAPPIRMNTSYYLRGRPDIEFSGYPALMIGQMPDVLHFN